MTEALVNDYLACWNDTDAASRRERLEQVFASDATYVDPMAEAAGREQLDATIAAVQEQFPGFVFVPVGTADTHHRQTRFQWGLGPEGAEPVVIGFDVVVTGDDGKVTQVLGFLDRVPG